jgi:DNA-binding transcriptional MerR regulator
MADDSHIYNLKAVMQEVGINAATLRAWERRYDLPKPQRSPGGHRLYSRQDIEMLKWLVARQNEGLSISHAVEMWNTQPEQRRDLAGQMETPTPVPAMGEAMLDELRGRWITACSSFDDASANYILDQAFVLATPETICTEVLQKGLVQIGEGWYAGTISVQQEHFATAIANRRIGGLLAAAALPTRREHILVACPPGELHDFILLMLTYLLRRHGWQAIYLGANVPLVNLDTTIKLTKPRLVLSAAQTLDAAASLREMSEYLVSLNLPLAFGGGIFLQVPAAIQHISGYYLGRDITSVAKQIEVLITTAPHMPQAAPIPLDYIIALKDFLQDEAGITAYQDSTLQQVGIEPAHLEIAITNLTRLITSALRLGDIYLMDPSINWLDGLLKYRGISPSITGNFYLAYMDAVVKYLGKNGAMISEWLAKLTRSHVNEQQ